MHLCLCSRSDESSNLTTHFSIGSRELTTSDSLMMVVNNKQQQQQQSAASSSSTAAFAVASSQQLSSSVKSPNTRTLTLTPDDDMNVSEMRELVLTMIRRKDEVEASYASLRAAHEETSSTNRGLGDKIAMLEREAASERDTMQKRTQMLEQENGLLKEQLKKYVQAVQLIRSSADDYGSATATAAALAVAGASSLPPIPKLNPMLQRDYSYEAEQYEKKLIQVAEMHGELMEFNSRLHKIILNKTYQVDKLKAELIELRGPVSKSMSKQT